MKNLEYSSTQRGFQYPRREIPRIPGTEKKKKKRLPSIKIVSAYTYPHAAFERGLTFARALSNASGSALTPPIAPADVHARVPYAVSPQTHRFNAGTDRRSMYARVSDKQRRSVWRIFDGRAFPSALPPSLLFSGGIYVEHAIIFVGRCGIISALTPRHT